MHGSQIVNAGVDSMGGVIDGGVEVSSAPSAQQSSYLEKTQAELRETFNAAEKFKRELEFLQKGGDPLDLKVENGTSVSLQSTSLLDQHPEHFVTSEVKGSFAITASPHGDSVESSGRLGAPSVGEPNSADNLMLFDRENKFHEVEKRPLHLHVNNTVSDVALDLPKKSYKRRNRSRSNRDGGRSSSTDAGPRKGQPFLTSRHAPKDAKRVEHDDDSQEPKHLSNSNLVPKSPVKSTQPDIQETLGHVEQETGTKGFESKSSGSRNIPSLDDKNEDESVAVMKNVDSNGTMEVNLALNEAPSIEGSDVNTLNNDKALNSVNNTSNPCSASHNDNGSTVKEVEDLKGSESALQHESDILTSTKEHEDSILEEARIIEEKRKRIAGLSFRVLKSESHHMSHWHFVLEEMSWLANDFAQERLWKATAAAQISRRAAYSSRVRIQQQSSLWQQKQVAHTLAEAVMDFWLTVQVKCNGLEFEGSKKDTKLGLHQYGLRFLEYNSSQAQYSSAQAPMTPDRISDLGTIGISWEANLTEEDLFYTVPPGAIEDYRKSIESHLLQLERTGSSKQEEVDANGYDSVPDDTLEEDEGETNPYYLPGAFGGNRSSDPAQKKKKHFRSYGQRSYDTGHGSPFMPSHERAIGTQPSILSGKRPTTSINVSIPTKRVRTASRPRFTGPTGFVQAPNGPDALSGDNNSFQDEQSSLHGGSHMLNNMDVESGGEYEKQCNFDPTEVSNRPKKKKKTKHPGSMFGHQWQLDPDFQNDQNNHLKRRLDNRQLDSNGNSVASQTSNMSNSSKFMKLLVRDRGRKAKSLKTPSGQQGSGSPWSLFEDQALVVLVHDIGANWELVSDAINSTLQFKCIYRNSKECKERHKLLLDRNNGDGGDSAEDSGSSQSYPSTLPGIPEGSARQLFQRLQGPMEEDTLKSHFDKIITIWQKHHHKYKKLPKMETYDPKQRQQVHNSHTFALSQVCPNNISDGPILTPLDLCEAISLSQDHASVGYQGTHAGGLSGPNHGNLASMVSGPGPSSSLPGSSATGHGGHLASASTPLSPALREGRYGIPRAAPSSIDEQHRIQHLNKMSARSMQQSGLPPGPHSGTRVLPGGTGMGVMNGINRGMTMARPAFQGIASPSMLSPGVPPGSMHPGPTPSQGSLVRPRDALHMMRPNQNSELGTGSFPNQNNNIQTPGQPYLHPMSPQPSPHMPQHLQGPPTHPAYGMHLFKERQLHQQRLLQQQFATSNPVSPHLHQQPQQSQLPVSVSSPQSSTQIQPSRGPVCNPQTGVNLIVKQPPRQPPQPFQPPARKPHSQQAVKVMNGFSGDGGEQNAQGVAAAALKQSTHDSRSRSTIGQIQPPAASTKQKASHAPPLGSTTTNLRQPHLPQKVGSQTQATAGQRMIPNRKENASEPAQATEPDMLSPQSNTAGSDEHAGLEVNHDDGGV
ncbi:chromatin modification-related protein EAF1 A-like [Bidens hawaiensis]|uniref:chromatin modification-related protein EAF1 A-like n=1 Tax=Bidens hawaiensis TaxID=980011 RepID=UPI00404B7321